MPLLVAIKNPWDMKGPEFLTLYLPLAAVAFLLAFMIRRWARHRDPISPSSLPELDSYEMAYLAGGNGRAINTAVARLMDEGELEMVESSPPRFKQRGPLRPEAHEIESYVYESFACTDTKGEVLRQPHRFAGNILSPAREIAIARIDRVAAEQQARRLLGPVDDGHRAGVGLSKIAVAIYRERPVAILVVTCAVTAVASLIAFGRPLHRTPAGDQHLAALRKQFAELRDSGAIGRARQKRDAEINGQFSTGLWAFWARSLGRRTTP